MKLALFKAIATSFDAQVSHQVLAVFMHLHHLLERYALNISAKRIFTIDCLLHETSLANMFETSKPNIIELSTIENLSKLSKVISLAFRKNIYEQEIAYLGLAKILNGLQEQTGVE
jgi:hypothetical protein